jgi:hypothetical protein
MWGSVGLNTQTLKNGLKKYGRSGIITYLGLSSMVTTGTHASAAAPMHCCCTHALLLLLLLLLPAAAANCAVAAANASWCCNLQAFT